MASKRILIKSRLPKLSVIPGAGVVGAVVFGGDSVTVTLRSMLKLVGVGEPETVGVGEGGVGG